MSVQICFPPLYPVPLVVKAQGQDVGGSSSVPYCKKRVIKSTTFLWPCCIFTTLLKYLNLATINMKYCYFLLSLRLDLKTIRGKILKVSFILTTGKKKIHLRGDIKIMKSPFSIFLNGCYSHFALSWFSSVSSLSMWWWCSWAALRRGAESCLSNKVKI